MVLFFVFTDVDLIYHIVPSIPQSFITDKGETKLYLIYTREAQVLDQYSHALRDWEGLQTRSQAPTPQRF